MSAARIAFEQSERVLDGVKERPVEVEEFESRATREFDASQRSAAASSPGQLAAKLFERNGLFA